MKKETKSTLHKNKEILFNSVIKNLKKIFK